MLGTVGHLLVLLALVTCALSGVGFFLAARRASDAPAWLPVGRAAWGAMLLSLLGASGILFYLLLNHQYQYAYVYQQSSNDLPLHYLFSSFWAGQEGSFLLWMLMIGFVGVGFMRWTKSYEAPAMTVIALCQLFMISMIAGLQLGPLAIGSTPFATLAEKFPEAPIFQQNPGFVPADGTGLNDLLQNPWMTIHPPTLFVGFSLIIVPFALAIAALWKRKYTEWVRPALPWTLAAVGILGIGIAMGGYWAYVTLSFGGYWAWDPVENSSLVPWLVGIAALHTMLVQRKSGRSHKAALFLSILSFILVVYSTFLTRSGILGDISVHSFVDLGLYNQLLLWILAMAVVGFGLFAWRYRELPSPRQEPNVLSREFMIFSGAMLLCATAAVITLGTSAPIFGRLFRETPSGVPIEFYNNWTLPLALAFVFLAGLGQLFWWNKMSVEDLNRVLVKPLGLAVASTVAVLLFTPFVELTITPAAPQAPVLSEAGLGSGLAGFWAIYGQGLLLLLLVFAGFFALYGNGLVLWRVGRGNARMAGGALSHVGFALLILGVVASGGFSNPLSGAARPGQEPRDNFILARGETRTVEGYRVTYSGQEMTERGRTRYLLDFVDPQGRPFRLAPVAYEGGGEQWFLHPDVKRYVEKDIFAAVTPREATGIDESGTTGGEMMLAQGDSTVLGEGKFAVSFVGFDLLKGPGTTRAVPAGIPADAQMAVGARLEVTNLASGETRRLDPVYLVMPDRTEQFLQTRVADWDLTFTFTGMDVNAGQAVIAVEGVDVMPEDWLVVQAYEKPFIGLLWAGIIVLSMGFVVSWGRRVQDARFRRRRNG